MNKYVEGSYTTIDEAIHAVKALFTQGYAKEDLLLVTNDTNKDELSRQTEVRVTADLSMKNTHQEDGSMMDKVKDVITGDSGSDSSNDSEAADLLKNHQQEIKSGKIFLLAESSPDVDRDPTTDPNSGYDNHSSIEEPDVNSIPQTTDGFKKDNPEDIHVDNSDIMHRP